MDALSHILRAASKDPRGPLNILTAPAHERTESLLCNGLAHTFYAYRSKQVKDWNTNYAPLPKNYLLLDPALGENQLPAHIKFDLVLSQNRFGQYQLLAPIAQRLHIPLICYEHTMPMPHWTEGHLRQLKQMRGHINVFISEFSRAQWGWGPSEALVVHHGVDAQKFGPGKFERDNVLLSVVNDWINRDLPCGFKFWQEATKGLPVKVVGATPGLSEPAPSVEALVETYQKSRIFVNTSQYSPIPTALLEAAASECAIVSTATAMIPEVIQHGRNGLLAHTPGEMREYCQLLLKDRALCEKLGRAARETILKKFNLRRFCDEWDSIFRVAASIPYWS